MSIPKIAETYVSRRMDEILEIFKPGAKITVLVRSPGFPDRDFCLTSDDLGEAIAMLERRRAAGRTKVLA